MLGERLEECDLFTQCLVFSEDEVGEICRCRRRLVVDGGGRMGMVCRVDGGLGILSLAEGRRV